MHGASVRLQDVRIVFGDFIAVKGVNITVAEGEFFSFLGPSGCGKTTLLRAVSGFLHPTEGRVFIGDAEMGATPPNRRPTALIFQNLALFPLMPVWENITFSLEVKGASAAQRRKRADELLELIALPGQGDKKISELSGGQKQRVAIARALAAEPQVLLLDEPLSALDLKLRQHMRSELRAIQRRVGITFIYITHDQGEALTMSDHIAVMREGVIEQVADGNTLYDRPQTAFVASFVGGNNAFEGTVENTDGKTARIKTALGAFAARTDSHAPLKSGDRAIVFVRPESFSPQNGGAGDNQIKAKVVSQEFEGNLWHIALAAQEREIKMSIVNQGRALGFETGAEVAVGFSQDAACALPFGPLASGE
jgi:spermidine/putrescine transport system ATP-binding protein